MARGSRVRQAVVQFAEHGEVIANRTPKLRAVANRSVLEGVDRVPPLLNELHKRIAVCPDEVTRLRILPQRFEGQAIGGFRGLRLVIESSGRFQVFHVRLKIVVINGEKELEGALDQRA